MLQNVPSWNGKIVFRFILEDFCHLGLQKNKNFNWSYLISQ